MEIISCLKFLLFGYLNSSLRHLVCEPTHRYSDGEITYHIPSRMRTYLLYSHRIDDSVQLWSVSETTGSRPVTGITVAESR